MVCNGWSIKFHKIFYKIFVDLIREVSQLRESDPENYQNHPKTKLLANVLHCIKVDVPNDPNHRKFRLGKSLGEFTSWRRAKNNFSGMRYRLFFRFMSDNKTIVYAWINDDTCLRKDGAKTDVYAVFLKMLQKGIIEDEFPTLVKSSVDPPTK